MQFVPTDFDGVVLVKPERLEDERGYFARMSCTEDFADRGLTPFVQSSVSFNARRGTVRGMHFQLAPHGETKLVRCVRGAILDVVVDLRSNSPTYRRWLAFELNAANGHALYIPKDMAHGFQTLEDNTEVFYMITPSFKLGFAAGIRFDDPAIDVRWPLPISVIADKDRFWPLLREG